MPDTMPASIRNLVLHFFAKIVKGESRDKWKAQFSTFDFAERLYGYGKVETKKPNLQEFFVIFDVV